MIDLSDLDRWDLLMVIVTFIGSVAMLRGTALSESLLWTKFLIAMILVAPASVGIAWRHYKKPPKASKQ